MIRKRQELAIYQDNMPANHVNLDALIRRENFEVIVDPNRVKTTDDADKLKIVELEHDSFMFRLLRKPDFQRTTAHWTPEKVAGFIHSFVQGDLIPALILWRSEVSGSIFVIDGAHRLSALIAWVHDDYGDRQISMQSFREGSRKSKELLRKLLDNFSSKRRSGLMLN